METVETRDTGIRPQVLEQIRTMAARHGVDRVVLFGSRARGDYRSRSDIDLAFSGGDGPRFMLDVDEDTDTLLMFDMVDLARPVAPELRQSIEKEGLVIYEKV